MLWELVVVLFLFFVFTPILGMSMEMIKEWRKIHRRGGSRG